MRWIIGDLHGCYAELLQLIQQIKYRPGKDQLVMAGNLVDLGRQSKDVVDFVREGQASGSIQAIRGNHEDGWVRATQAGVEEWYAEQYPETWRSFKGRDGIQQLATWAETLPLYIETEHVLLVNGAVEVGSDLYRKGKIVVHGHTPTDYPQVYPDHINIDTGCVFGGRLTALSLDALERGEIRWESVRGWVKHDAS